MLLRPTQSARLTQPVAYIEPPLGLNIVRIHTLSAVYTITRRILEVSGSHVQDRSWDNFPNGTRFVSTLNFGNNSLDIARDMAVASVEYQKDKIDYFELGNEPTNYPSSRWNFSTDAYVAQWKNWTSQIDAAVNEAAGANVSAFPRGRWWASSATTDQTGLHVRPADIIPAGINSENQVAQYSIHS